MARKSIDLYVATDPAWVGTIVNNFDDFLADHANCERKASALAMSLVVKYPDRITLIPRLIEIAQEELEHFRQVYVWMLKRGISALPDRRDPYVNRLLALRRHGRDDGLLDQLLIASLIECRGAERFGLIADALADADLKRFYHDLWAAEIKHGHVFVDLALRCFDNDTVYERLHVLARAEADILQSLDWTASLH